VTKPHMKNSEVTTASASLVYEAGAATAVVGLLTFAIAIQLGAGKNRQFPARKDKLLGALTSMIPSNTRKIRDASRGWVIDSAAEHSDDFALDDVAWSRADGPRFFLRMSN